MFAQDTSYKVVCESFQEAVCRFEMARRVLKQKCALSDQEIKAVETLADYGQAIQTALEDYWHDNPYYSPTVPVVLPEKNTIEHETSTKGTLFSIKYLKKPKGWVYQIDKRKGSLTCSPRDKGLKYSVGEEFHGHLWKEPMDRLIEKVCGPFVKEKWVLPMTPEGIREANKLQLFRDIGPGAEKEITLFQQLTESQWDELLPLEKVPLIMADWLEEHGFVLTPQSIRESEEDPKKRQAQKTKKNSRSKKR